MGEVAGSGRCRAACRWCWVAAGGYLDGRVTAASPGWRGSVSAPSLVAGLLGPIAIAVYAVLISLPVWIAGWWLSAAGLSPADARPAAQQGGVILSAAPPAIRMAGRLQVQARPPALTPRQ